MIKNVFYIDGMTYIKDMNDKEVTTQTLGFAKSFDFAWKNDVEFDYGSINKDDERDFSHFLQYQVGSCDNRNISDFFQLCEEYGIRTIIGNNTDLFGRRGVKDTIAKIISDYNSEVAIYNIECYGTDTYIAQVVYEHLMIYNASHENNSKVYTLLKIVDCDDYNLDVFLDIVKQFASQSSNNKIIQDFKQDFVRDYECSSETIEMYIPPLVTYGGDYSHKIYKAMLEVIDDISNGKPFCDRKGFIEYLKEEDND